MERSPTMERTGASRSLWMATADPPVFAPLSADAHARVCVVGAGIAGLSTAYRLAKAGLDVVVLDESDLHGGQTARTTGHLCDALDDRWFELEQLHGVEGARLAAHSHAVAIDTTGTGGPKLNDLVAIFDQLKVPADDRISIIQELYKTGKLHAKLIVE